MSSEPYIVTAAEFDTEKHEHRGEAGDERDAAEHDPPRDPLLPQPRRLDVRGDL